MNEEHAQLLRTVSGLPWGQNVLSDLFGKTNEPPVSVSATEEAEQAAPSGCVRALSAEHSKLLAAVHIEIRIEIGEVRLSVEELLDLVPGKTFRHELPPDCPLVLRLGEHKIGEARLVRENGSLALEILSVSQQESGEQHPPNSRKDM